MFHIGRDFDPPDTDLELHPLIDFPVLKVAKLLINVINFRCEAPFDFAEPCFPATKLCINFCKLGIHIASEITGNYPVTSTPEEFSAFISKEAERWRRVIKDINLKFD